MKKIFKFLLSFIMLFSFCSCDPGPFIVKDEYIEDVVSIDLIQYDNDNQKVFMFWVINQFDKLKPFDFENETVLTSLSTNKIKSFLNAFKKEDILASYYVFDSPKDNCIKLSYSNGNFLIIWSNYKDNSYVGYIGLYSPIGDVLEYWGCFSGLDSFYKLSSFFAIELS